MTIKIQKNDIQIELKFK